MVGNKRAASVSATEEAALLSGPEEITADIVRTVAQEGQIPKEELPRLEQRLRLMLSIYWEAQRFYSGLQTKKDKIEQLEKIEKLAVRLKQKLDQAWVKSLMIDHERLKEEVKDRAGTTSAGRQPNLIRSRMLTGQPSAETRVTGDLAGVANVEKRLDAIIADLKIRPRDALEQLASTTAAKPAIHLLTWHMVTYWEKVLNRDTNFDESSQFVQFARAVYALVDRDELPIETIRYRYDTMKLRFEE
jgi:hypothetical protein